MWWMLLNERSNDSSFVRSSNPEIFSILLSYRSRSSSSVKMPISFGTNLGEKVLTKTKSFQGGSEPLQTKSLGGVRRK